MDNKPKPITPILIKLASRFKWIWCFLPGILGMLFVYWAEGIGYQAWILKEYHETIAICLMSIASLLYLIRAISCRKEIDLILLAMSVNFLCREIHFTGTDNAVVIVAGLVLVWVVIRKKQIWESIRVAKLFQISLVGAAFTYFFFDINRTKSFFLRTFSVTAE